MFKLILSALLSLSLTAPAFAQSQGANGAIEGTVSDSSGGVLPGVTVTITNLDTGAYLASRVLLRHHFEEMDPADDVFGFHR